MPIDPSALMAFIVAALVVVISPGPDTLVILRCPLASGRRVGLATVKTGVQLGLAIHTTMAIIGLSAIIATECRLCTVRVRRLAHCDLAGLGCQSINAPVSYQLDNMDGLIAGDYANGLRRCLQSPTCLNRKVIFLFLALNWRILWFLRLVMFLSMALRR